MNNELTNQDIQIMQQELDHLRLQVLPDAIEEVKRTRAFGDLSENYEYKAAKQEQRAIDSRIRYLNNMIRTARIVDQTPKGSNPEGARLYDKVTVYIPEDEEEMVIQVVSTVRVAPDKGFISLESPLGKAVLGKKVTVKPRKNALASALKPISFEL